MRLPFPFPLSLLALLSAGDFPWWLRASHWINAFFIGYLFRAGIQILGLLSTSLLERRQHTGPLMARVDPEEYSYQPRLDLARAGAGRALLSGHPGGNNLGLGRIWHFFVVIFWILNGVVYVTLLSLPANGRASSQPTGLSSRAHGRPSDPDGMRPSICQRPASFSLRSFATAHLLRRCLPARPLSHRHRRLAVQSPAIAARFPWYLKIFGGRQAARSLHFLGLLAFCCSSSPSNHPRPRSPSARARTSP